MLGPCPVLEAYVQSVIELNRDRSRLTRDLVLELEELEHRCQQERPPSEVVLQRAFRAFELAYVAVFSTSLVGLLERTTPFAGPDTISDLLRRLDEFAEHAVVFDVERKLGQQNARGREQLIQIRMDRVVLGARTTTACGEWLKENVENAERRQFSRIGLMLSMVANDMAVGLTDKVAYAEELMKHGGS